jgi:hypothetical protein
MQGTWGSFEAAVARHVPRFVTSLRSPASDGALADLEKTIGRSLPAGVRHYLRIHDGQAMMKDRLPEPEFLATHRLLSCLEIADRWRLRQDLHSRAPRAGGAPWPFIDITDSDGDAIVVDARDGVVYFDVRGEGIFGPIAPCLEAWLDDFATRIANDDVSVEASGTDDVAIWLEDYNPAFVPNRFGPAPPA